VARGEVTATKEFKRTLTPSLLYTGLARVVSEEELLVYYKAFNKEEEAKIQEKLALYEYAKCHFWSSC